MREQIKFIFQIGYAAQSEAFETAVIKAASSLCGGCTTRCSTGWWKADGDEKKAAFHGKLEQEHCFELELTCELHKAERVYQDMTGYIAAAAQGEGVDTNWVHVSETVMRGRHFSVAAINNRAAIAAE